MKLSQTVFAVLLYHSFAWALPSIEVVQSVPMETKLLVPGIRQTQEVWLEMIQGAKSKIDLEQFYVSDEAGQALAPVLSAIREAASRGVKVRFLVDTKFFATYPDPISQLGHVSGIQVKKVDFASYGGVQHAKYFIVDGRNAFVGSQNFDWRALSHIHEIGLRVDDLLVGADLEMIFEKDWAMGSLFVEESNLLRMPGVTTVVASPTKANPSGISDTLSEVLKLIGEAKEVLKLQVMEYSTHIYGSIERWKILDDALRAAAAKGVRVQLLVDVSDLKKAKDDLLGLAQVKNIEVKTVTIPQWSGGAIPFARLIHSKYLVADHVSSWVGSENWSQGYFMNTRNVGLLVSRPEISAQLEQVFDTVWLSEYSLKLQ